ncbi:hypothetical protein P7C70_g4645, partial [Phenoliferia sp. Uapishka_3]
MKSFDFNGAPIGAVAILLALFSSVGGFIFGYDTGQISDFLVMPDFLVRFASCTDRSDYTTCKFSNVRTGLIVSMLSIGTAVGALIGANIADRLGRRKAISIDCIVVSIGTIIQVCSFHSWEQLMVGRIITGLGIGALSAVVPLYQSETAPKEIRGSLVATYQLFITFGILIAYCISIGTRNASSGGASWRIVCSLNILWSLILGVGITFAPESPRWLMANGREPEAEAALAKIRGVEVSDNDVSVRQSYVEMEEAVQHEKSLVKATWFDCFRVENKTLYRTQGDFHNLNSCADKRMSQFGGIYILERFGRCKPLIIGGIWQSAWLFVFAAAGTAKDPTTSKGIGTLQIVSACLFIAGYASSWAPCIWILVGETFPTRTRAKQGALATSANWTWNFLIGIDVHKSPSLFTFLTSDSREDFNKAIEAEKKNLAMGMKSVQHRELAEEDDAHQAGRKLQ